jgi:hypothetical protein
MNAFVGLAHIPPFHTEAFVTIQEGFRMVLRRDRLEIWAYGTANDGDERERLWA